MSIFTAGINYENSSIEQRELLSFTPDEITKICKKICTNEDVKGCIILSTCNRTEIYISTGKDLPLYMEYDAAYGTIDICQTEENTADKLLLKYADISNFNTPFDKKTGIDAVRHIITLACGLKSQILGESQISGQINTAWEISYAAGCTDAALDTLFRIAVSAGKKALTEAKLSAVPTSSADAAVNFLQNKYGLKGKKCVVIGSGKMGRLAQTALLKYGCSVTATLRSYKHGGGNAAPGCKTIAYDERYNAIDGCDFVLSATRSPHYTVTFDKLKTLHKLPQAVVDLALPRDVEPTVQNLCKVYNLSDICTDNNIDDEQIENVYDIAEKYTDDFVRWQNYKISLPNINSIKQLITKRVGKSMEADNVNKQNPETVIEFAVDRTVDMLLGAMKDSVEPKAMENCRNKIEERARL